MTHNAFTVLGVRVDAVQIPDVISRMEHWIQGREHGNYIVVANTHVVMEGYKDHEFREVINSSAVTVPDGMPLILIARRRGFSLKRRVYGPDLMWAFFEGTAQRGYRHFFYGGSETTLERLAVNLKDRFPSLEVCGCYSPPFRPLTPMEDRQVVKTINEAAPDVLWVGLGCPKQERWMYGHRDQLEVPGIAGVGQAFDIFARVKKQAPSWMRDHGFEWLFRLMQEPRRLWKRYLIHAPMFVHSVLLEELGLRRFD